MSRAARERWAEGAERWPHLQAFLSERLAEYLFGNVRSLADKFESELTLFDGEQRSKIATECWAFMRTFKDRQDDRQFLRDGFGVRGTLKTDDRGRGQNGLRRLKIVYDAFATSVRFADTDWQPGG